MRTLSGSPSAGAPGSPTAEAVRRVLLVGFMASGKSAVGAALAARLAWEHLDVDTEIERAEGRSVTEIFRRHGEAYFRRRESEVAAPLLAREACVISSGGGWVTGPGWSALPAGTLSVWLRVSPEEVLRRTGAEAERRRRPLLAADPEDAVRRLLGERTPLYARAEVSISTDGREPAELAALIEQIVRSRGPAPFRG